MGKLWNLIEDYRDGLAFPPSFRQIAIRMGVSQSTFDTWKNPTELPKPRNLLAISRLTGVPYRRVVDAAVEDTGLYDEKVAERDAAAILKGKKIPEVDAEPFDVGDIAKPPRPRSTGS